MKLYQFTESEKQYLLSRIPEVKERLLGNLMHFPQYPEQPLIQVGDAYPGIWLEHNQDNVFLSEYAPESAWASQDAFMRYQREDGLFPVFLSFSYQDPESWMYNMPIAYTQVQVVYPFARCAFEIAKKTGRPRSDFERIYRSGCAYDAWFENKRNTSGSGLVEMFCEYDTGHDNDPRVKDGGIPHLCEDAAVMPDCPVLPVLSVDLSAAVYGGRTALAEVAEFLGKTSEAAHWRAKAEQLKKLIRERLYDPEDEFYYDVDKNGFRKYRTEHVTRLFLNHVLTQEEFDAVYDRYFTTPGKEFLPEFPIPSVSIDDPHFDHNCPKNSWGCNTQSLTTLRATFWMDYYNRSEDLTALLSHWLRSFCDHPETTFQQEINPFTGNPIGTGVNFTPTLLVYLEAVKRMNWRAE